jgi:hypothetical protein
VRAEPTERRSTWAPILVRILVAAIVLTPLIAIIIQALGKR